MNTLKKASCGTMESSDAYMELEPIEAGTQIELQSVVEHQFGDSIRALAAEMLKEEGVENVKLSIVDRGALECTLRARLETLIGRAREEAAHA
ncbi:MAG: citrate lyase acyl carrier protein [Firmicutes bacterium]|jgi:citrate lyase subunit gamma (acyl carrier protein)|nr:citrate lyase acyl carrier protein [Bacillota bacterium]MBQ2084371.1 citrate lyase acyl carrier protein [Bacillota bacterium]MBQ2218759.1 citrate lyase acyl carrier protein [Bacillota bacterium]MBQ2227626.1 citrate lyase acyl carrier protein [Bacillota bacterium]